MMLILLPVCVPQDLLALPALRALVTVHQIPVKMEELAAVQVIRSCVPAPQSLLAQPAILLSLDVVPTLVRMEELAAVQPDLTHLLASAYRGLLGLRVLPISTTALLLHVLMEEPVWMELIHLHVFVLQDTQDSSAVLSYPMNVLLILARIQELVIQLEMAYSHVIVNQDIQARRALLLFQMTAALTLAIMEEPATVKQVHLPAIAFLGLRTQLVIPILMTAFQVFALEEYALTL